MRGILRYWWVPLVTLGAALIIATAVTILQRDIYRVSTSVIVGPAPHITNAREIMEVYNTLDRRSVMATLARSPMTGAVRGQVAAEVGPVTDYQISAVVVPDTNILEISVDGPDAELAGRIAASVAAQTAVYSSSLYPSFEIKTLDPPGFPVRVKPSAPRNLAIGTVLGLLAGLGLAVVYPLIESAYLRAAQAKQRARAFEPAAGEKIVEGTGI